MRVCLKASSGIFSLKHLNKAMGCIRTETTLINGNEKSQPCDSAQDEQYGAVVARDMVQTLR